VTGRDRTCDAPRFRRALYRAELRSRERWAEPESNRRFLRIREALCHLSYPPSGRGWARTSSLLFVRQALFRLSYSPETLLSQLRDKESNLDLHVQSVVSCRLDDPGTNERSRASPSISVPGDRRSRRAPSLRPSCHAGQRPSDVFHATRLPFDPGSPAAGCARPRRSSSCVEELWSPSLTRPPGNSQAKANANSQR
jgi:hypothetical protein